MRYPVRCCCRPQKLLGYLELRPGLRHGDRVTVWPRLRFPVVPLSVPEDSPPVQLPEPEVIELREVRLAVATRPGGSFEWREELAVYGDGRPDDFWATLPGFTKA
jgi:hypothetical protein